MPFKKITYCLFALLFGACGTEPSVKQNTVAQNETSGMLYAEGFSLVKKDTYSLLYLFSRGNHLDTVNKFVLATDTTLAACRLPQHQLVKIPVNNVAALGSLYANMLEVLNALDCLKAVDDIRYIGNESILAKHRHQALVELGLNPEIDIEKTWRLKPQIIFTSGIGKTDNAINTKLKNAGIPLCYITDHLEKSPLARAEWIKVIAAFLNKDQDAANLFDSTVARYRQLTLRTKDCKNKPTVFTEARFGDVWYMPGGASYMAAMLKDAGANYLWADNNETGSLPLSFEQVFVKAADADFWLNPSAFKSLNDMQQSENRYTAFKAFKTGKVYNNNLHLNQYGYGNYWESGLLFPDRVLHDLIVIFHPELNLSTEEALNYYKHLH